MSKFSVSNIAFSYRNLFKNAHDKKLTILPGSLQNRVHSCWLKFSRPLVAVCSMSLIENGVENCPVGNDLDQLFSEISGS